MRGGRGGCTCTRTHTHILAHVRRDALHDIDSFAREFAVDALSDDAISASLAQSRGDAGAAAADEGVGGFRVDADNDTVGGLVWRRGKRAAAWLSVWAGQVADGGAAVGGAQVPVQVARRVVSGLEELNGEVCGRTRSRACTAACQRTRPATAQPAEHPAQFLAVADALKRQDVLRSLTLSARVLKHTAGAPIASALRSRNPAASLTPRAPARTAFASSSRRLIESTRHTLSCCTPAYTPVLSTGGQLPPIVLAVVVTAALAAAAWTASRIGGRAAVLAALRWCGGVLGSDASADAARFMGRFQRKRDD